jgi:hypothetical protein
VKNTRKSSQRLKVCLIEMKPGCAADAPNRIINVFPSLALQVKNTWKSSQRLKDCLMEMNLAVPPVLLMVPTGLLTFSLLFRFR